MDNLQKRKNHFLKRCYEKYEDTYDYSKVNYINSNTKIEIICRRHGSFFQLPKNHLRQNCPKCGYEILLNKKKRNTFEDFKKLLSNEKLNKYDYSKMKSYSYNSIEIFICPIHGEFKQRVKNHIESNGCYKCGRNNVKNKTTITLRENLLKLKKPIPKNVKIISSLNDKYSSKDIIEFECSYHGYYKQSLSSLKAGCTCPTCSKRGFSRSEFTNMCKRKNIKIATFYILKIYNEEESFYKFGITISLVKERFRKLHLSNYQYEIIDEWYDTPLNIWNKENKYRKLVSKKRYIPKNIFPGYTECFTELIDLI